MDYLDRLLNQWKHARTSQKLARGERKQLERERLLQSIREKALEWDVLEWLRSGRQGEIGDYRQHMYVVSSPQTTAELKKTLSVIEWYTKRLRKELRDAGVLDARLSGEN